MKSFKKVKISDRTADVEATVTTEVVEHDIPLLLTKEGVEKAKTQIGFKEDLINIFDKMLEYISVQLVIIVWKQKVNSLIEMHLSPMLYFFAVMYKIYPIHKNIKLL